MKLVTIVGTRPEIIRLSCIIKMADKYFDHVFVHTGQNWDTKLKDIFFNEFNLREPDHYLDVVGDDLGDTIGNIISKSYKLFKEIKPDAILLLGDTNSALSAISAKRLKIPIFHMEAGNRCFDQNVPEEINRKIVDHIADINLCYTEHARRYLLAEGFRRDHVFVTGSPMAEVIVTNIESIYNSSIMEYYNLKKCKYIVLSLHREENIDNDNNFNELLKIIDKVCDEYKLPIVFSVHPRTKKRLESANIKLNDLVVKINPVGFFEYCNLQFNAACVLSDSGTLTEEAAILNFPAVSIRTSTERPEGLDKGNIIIGGLDHTTIIDSINIAINTRTNTIVKPIEYEDTNVSVKIIKIIQSYTGLINKFIWNK